MGVTNTALAVVEQKLTRRERLANQLELAVEQLSEKEALALLTGGDLGALTPAVRIAYYEYRCRQLGLDPMSQPFDIIALSGKVVLYANRRCADQLRVKHGISVFKHEVSRSSEYLTVYVYGRDKTGREEMNCASTFVGTLKGEAAANAEMKTLTKALRRLTLAMTGTGLLDEAEATEVRGAKVVSVTAEVLPSAPIITVKPDDI